MGIVVSHQWILQSRGYPRLSTGSILREAYICPDSYDISLECSRNFERLSRDRSVWAQLVKTFCAQMFLILDTVVHDLETLTASQLEALATRPMRFRHKARRHTSISSEPLPSRSHTIHIQSADDRPLESVKFLRGGRFLFTLSLKTAQIYDLGLDENVDLSNLSPICRFSTGNEMGPGGLFAAIHTIRIVDGVIQIGVIYQNLELG